VIYVLLLIFVGCFQFPLAPDLPLYFAFQYGPKSLCAPFYELRLVFMIEFATHEMSSHSDDVNIRGKTTTKAI